MHDLDRSFTTHESQNYFSVRNAYAFGVIELVGL